MPPEPPRIVLFGRPGAGKSSLLGALVQAGRTQGQMLGVEVVDPSRTLDAIHDHLYEAAPLEDSRAEVVAHAVRLRPWRAGPKEAWEQPTVLLCDCDGTAANALLKHPGSVAAGTLHNPLARAIEGADALFLVVSAADRDDELHDTFRVFHTFLDAVETRREFERAIGGLPVLLVLTHCDLLARPGDTFAAWQARMADRKAHVLKRFADYFEGPNGGEAAPFLPFGSVDLEVRATAVRRPHLADQPANANEPYGVAELFRVGFAAARLHQVRMTTSSRRLTWTVRGVGAFFAALVAALLAAVVLPPPASDPGLADRVRGFERSEGVAEVRLAAKNLPRERRMLGEFRANAAFDQLPTDLREFVDNRLHEIEDYQAYAAKLHASTAPADVRNGEDLAKVETHLKVDLALPPEYAWGETEAGRLRDKWLRDAALIRDAERLWDERFREWIRRATHLEIVSFSGDWQRDVTAFFSSADGLPFKLAEPLPGSQSLPQPRGAAVPYAVPFEFDRVYQARKDWEFRRDRLRSLRDLADALGLTAGPDRKPAGLQLPEPGPEVDSAKLPGTRWAELRQAYPVADATYPGWAISGFPEPARIELDRRLRSAFETGVRHVHKLLRPDDTPAGWRAVAAGLNEVPYSDWAKLLTLLARLRDPKAPDPVAELAAFLSRDRFDLDLRGFELTLPDDLREQRAVPAGNLVVTLNDKPLVTLKPVGDGQRGNGATTFIFAAEGNAKLTYRPGDRLTAELPLRAGGQDFMLAWTENRSDVFQFERLRREARVLRPGLPSEPALGVRLAPTKDTVLPEVPVLLPNVRGR